MKDARNAIVHWALTKAAEKRANPAASLYTEGSQRSSCRFTPLAPCFIADCSYAIECYYAWAGAPDPSRGAPDPYTGTLIACGREVSLQELRVGDVVIYFNGPGYEPSTGSHVALIVALGPDYASDPLTVSFGQQSEPGVCRVSQDGRAHKFYTYNTMTKKVVYPPGVKKSRQ